MVNRRAFHQAVLLSNGDVLLASGIEDFTPLATAELYDPSSGTFTATAGPLNVERFDAASVALSDGRVLIAGGTGDSGALDTAETYNPAMSSFTLAANTMSIGRTSLSAAVLPTGGW
jgi:Galactose oxidase, central domain